LIRIDGALMRCNIYLGAFLALLLLSMASSASAQSVDPLADSGSADAGTASTVIAHVTANDTVNGAPAILGSQGNSTVAKVGTWPSGINLTAATGTVSSSASVSPGVYAVSYQLCDKNKPRHCATTTDTITVILASIVAVADTGSALAGIVATPTANVAANDSIDGDAAALGAAGNASVAKVGTWPVGISLNATTGAVTTAGKASAGIYSLQYHLCDKNIPPVCASTIDTVTLTAAAVVAVQDSGGALAGFASTPIANVAANDTVNGAPATLGSGGNAFVTKVGAWPVGIALKPATGSITTSAAVPPGIYDIQYQLCATTNRSECATTSDTITLTAAAISASPDNGIAIVGADSTPIISVVANDAVNGVQASLGPSGNATITQSGIWPTGIALDTTSGAVTAAGSVPGGVYQIQYQLCDTNVAANCAVATDTVLVTAASTEVQVSTVEFGDIEFDWGRDGIYCATCNFGQGNARFNWGDTSGNLWVGHVDPSSGNFTPAAGNNELADTLAFDWLAFGNGAEWAFSTQNGQVISQLVYTRYAPGQTATAPNAGVGFATPVSGGWSADFLPATGPNSGATINTFNPIATQCNSDPLAWAVFSDLSIPQDVFSEPITTAAGTAPVETPYGPYFSVGSGGKPGVRWVPCTHQLVFVGNAPPDSMGNVYQQVFWYDADSQVVQQLTADSRGETEAFMFRAPELGDNFVFFTIAGNTEIDVFEQSGVASNGAPTFQLVNQITSPDPTEPNISSTEAFINCTPSCQTYIFMKLSEQVITPTNKRQVANGVAVASISPTNPFFEILVPTWATPSIERQDLEYYITAAGPYLYYDIDTIASGTSTFQAVGRYYVDMHLGAPTGPCVGSSAEGGLLPGC